MYLNIWLIQIPNHYFRKPKKSFLKTIVYRPSTDNHQLTTTYSNTSLTQFLNHLYKDF
jgi:hypothetical protein